MPGAPFGTRARLALQGLEPYGFGKRQVAQQRNAAKQGSSKGFGY